MKMTNNELLEKDKNDTLPVKKSSVFQCLPELGKNTFNNQQK